MPKVSVLLPNYNNSLYLEEAISSVLEQSFTDFELIIVDDCSTDSSLSIIKSFHDDRIILIEKEKNSGIVDALNAGIDRVKGEYIIRMDGDDISMPGRFQKLVDFMELHPNVGVCSSAIQNFGLLSDLWSFEKNKLKNKAYILFGLGIGHASSIFRSSLFKLNNIRYSNGYHYVEDYKLFTDLNEITLFSSIDEPLYFYRRTEGSSTISNKEVIESSILKVYQEQLSKLLNRKATENEMLTHYQLHSGRFLAPIKTYSKWCKKLLKANKTNKIYPQPELSEVIERKLKRIQYKALDSSPKNLWDILMDDNRINFKMIWYAFKRCFH